LVSSSNSEQPDWWQVLETRLKHLIATSNAAEKQIAEARREAEQIAAALMMAQADDAQLREVLAIVERAPGHIVLPRRAAGAVEKCATCDRVAKRFKTVDGLRVCFRCAKAAAA